MGICEDCSLEEKIYQCCARLPSTGESVPYSSGDVVTRACPRLGQAGTCTAYDERPRGCREFYCDAYRRMEKGMDETWRKPCVRRGES